MALSHVTVTFRSGRVTALRDVSAEIAAGTHVSVTGRSGSGKSTLLNLLGGLLRADQGSVIVGDTDLTKASGRRRSRHRADNVGFVFQSSHMVRGPVEANVLLGARYRRMDRARARDRARELIARVGLANRIGDHPDELSGGERQRIAIARALMGHPRLILADEPTGNLDPSTAAEITELLEEVARDEAATLLVVTHDPALADRAPLRWHLDEGRLVAPVQA
ncbi:MAG: ATP-binding cassette domain-containing protein [Deltaproteobacteria bacterium]|nr:MAG: ATP-binding cassette domain-containing protein [Deltaproteobacteria bacterium]